LEPWKIPPFSCQLIPNLGTEGGFKLNFPLMLKLGILSLGKLQLKLKNPFILSMAVLTASLALLIGFIIASLIPFQIFVTEVFTASNLLDMLVLIPSAVFDTVVLASFILL